MSNYPFHHVIAKPTTFVPTNYYGCDPYNTVDARAMHQHVHKVMRLVSPYRGKIHENAPLRTWSQTRYMK